MQTYYSRRAHIYDESMGYDQPEVVSALQPVITYLQENLRNRTVLELACGPCFWTQHVAQTAKKIVATDINATTIEEAQKKSLDPNRVSLMVADAYNLPTFPERFDGAFAVDTFCHVPLSRRKDFLEGLHRKLSPSSVVLLCGQIAQEGTGTGQRDEEGNHLESRSLPDGSQHTIIKNFSSDEEFRDIFGRYSQDVTIEKFPAEHRYVIRYQVSRSV